MGKLPKHLQKRLNPTTRSRSEKQEKAIRKDLAEVDGQAYVSINSGATFGQNDVTSENWEIEAKTTTKGSFSIKKAYWREVRRKCDIKKIPAMVVDFEGSDPLSLVVMEYKDFIALVEFFKSS